jgi:hypothetical protein
MDEVLPAPPLEPFDEIVSRFDEGPSQHAIDQEKGLQPGPWLKFSHSYCFSLMGQPRLTFYSIVAL